MRIWWATLGLLCVGLGGIGFVVPGLPSTVFFVMAAWCFSRSSPRLERWLLNLPAVGPLVADYRAGLGMPRKAKVIAITMIVAAVSLSVLWGLDHLALQVIVAAVGAVGVWYVGWRVPTRERLA